MSGQLFFVLSKPVHVVLSGAHGPRREQTIDRVALRPLAVKDLTLLDQYWGRPMQLAARAVSALSGLTLAQVNKIDLSDYQPIAATALRLLTEGSDAIGLSPGWFIDSPAPDPPAD